MIDDNLRMLRQDFWDERYGSAPQIWSGRPNPHLVDRIGDRPPGRALDVGSGEGADAIWLAQRGWEVTAVDVSPVALARAATHAEALGSDVADRITWSPRDLLRWAPEPGSFDLVSSQFMHMPPPQRRVLFAGLAESVATGGTLLVVGHHPSQPSHGHHPSQPSHGHHPSQPSHGHHPPEREAGHPEGDDLRFTAEEVADGLDPGTWEIVLADAPVRDQALPSGEVVAFCDARLEARRRA